MGELPEQAGLADTGLADERHHLAVAGTGLLQRPRRAVDLGLASNERGEPAGGGRLEAFARGPAPDQLEDLDGLSEPFDRHRTQRRDLDEPLDQPQSVGRQQDAPGRGELLHAGGQVDGLAHRGVVHVQVVTDARTTTSPLLRPTRILYRDAAARRACSA